MSYAIETFDLAYRAGKHFEIRDLALKVREGSIYGFLGPNGSGKTTTIRLMLGMLKPIKGMITVLGRRVPAEMARIICPARREPPTRRAAVQAVSVSHAGSG